MRSDGILVNPGRRLLQIFQPVRIAPFRASVACAVQSNPEQLSQLQWQDLVIALLLSLAAAYASYQGTQLIDPAMVQSVYNVWFDADSPRVYATMTEAGSILHEESSRRHPLFSLITFAPVYFLRKGAGIETMDAVRLTMAAGASLWTILLYALLRFIVPKSLDALLFTLLAATSASAMFWFVMPETFAFGSITILLPLGLVALAQSRRLSPVWFVIASAASLSVTVTNWMAGIVAAFVHHRWWRTLEISAYAFAVVVALWALQKHLFHTSIFFLGAFEIEEQILDPDSGGPLYVLTSFLLHSMVMPLIETTYWVATLNLLVMTVQPSLPGSGSLWGAIAVPLWLSLLVLGLWGLLSSKRDFHFRLALGLVLIGQLTLHLVFGRETFLYSLHFMPLLVLLASFSVLTPPRILALSFTGILIVLLAINNGLQFEKALEFVQRETTQESYVVRAAMMSRPDDPWPRSAGHVVLGFPGSDSRDKAYHEPGGSFSPSAGSFGVSIWLADSQGKLKISSDNIPMTMFQQRFVANDTGAIPGIRTDSLYYRALWSSAGPGRWLLNLNTPNDPALKPIVMIRSVGPAGGPVRSLNWDGEQLLINQRWKVTVTPKPVKVHLGQEGSNGWMAASGAGTRWESRDGWGYARIELAQAHGHSLLISDAHYGHTATLRPSPRAVLNLDLPEERFIAGLQAQIAHLLMGVVNRETRPGDPISYPFAWLRDEAYVIVALARAGQLSIAKELSRHLAENDFFGGYGAEADAPGLAIWALVEVALQLREAEYDRWLWPHIQRKAELITEMLLTNRSIHKPLLTPVVPLFTKPFRSAGDPNLPLVSEPSRDGLIVGRVNYFSPVYYVNAVSYRGLLDAATLAERLGRISEADTWRTHAARMKQAWHFAFEKDLPGDKWTYSTWLSWVVDRNATRFLNGLEARWVTSRKPAEHPSQTVRTHFEVAEAHQWLLLGREDRVWHTLGSFWNDQASPGLYTWSESRNEPSHLRHWERIRGWVKPSDPTPSYRTAAEMLLLQLDMLAYVDESASLPTLVIGAGIPSAWLTQSIEARGLSTRLGAVDWSWDGHEVNVKIRGPKVQVQLGSTFARGTPLKVEYLDEPSVKPPVKKPRLPFDKAQAVYGEPPTFPYQRRRSRLRRLLRYS